jgi:hypothetical protein
MEITAGANVESRDNGNDIQFSGSEETRPNSQGGTRK